MGMDAGSGVCVCAVQIQALGQILTPAPGLGGSYPVTLICTSDFAGADRSSPIGLVGAYSEVMQHITVGCSTGKPACRLQCRLGLGCVFRFCPPPPSEAPPYRTLSLLHCRLPKWEKEASRKTFNAFCFVWRSLPWQFVMAYLCSDERKVSILIKKQPEGLDFQNFF